MAWFILVIAGLLEVTWAIGMKISDGFSKPIPSLITIVAMILSMWLLSVSSRHLPMGTAYAVWTGIGAAGTAFIGMLWLGEPRETARIVCILLIVAGIAGLKLFSKS